MNGLLVVSVRSLPQKIAGASRLPSPTPDVGRYRTGRKGGTRGTALPNMSPGPGKGQAHQLQRRLCDTNRTRRTACRRCCREYLPRRYGDQMHTQSTGKIGLTASEREGLTWLKAQSSTANGQCVEIAAALGNIAVRDSKDPDGPVLVYTPSEFRAFLDGARNGEFDAVLG